MKFILKSHNLSKARTKMRVIWRYKTKTMNNKENQREKRK